MIVACAAFQEKNREGRDRAVRQGQNNRFYPDSYMERQVRDNWAMMMEVLASERQQRNISEHSQAGALRVDRDRPPSPSEIDVPPVGPEASACLSPSLGRHVIVVMKSRCGCRAVLVWH